MDLVEIRNRKQALEIEIRNMLRTFEKETDCKITEIHVSRMQMRNFLEEVKVDVVQAFHLELQL